MTLTVSDVEEYLVDVYSAVQSGRYQLSARQKNQDMFIDYVFTEEDARQVLLSLTAYDFQMLLGTSIHNILTKYYIFLAKTLCYCRDMERKRRRFLYILRLTNWQISM